MNGFITESVSKISDGIINTIKLILFYALTSLLIVPIEHYFQRPGILIYIFLLLATAGFELLALPNLAVPGMGWRQVCFFGR